MLLVLSVISSPFLFDEVEAQVDVSETWTFMSYMSGDSSLSDQIPSDILEMKKVGSGDGLEIIVLMDREGVGDTSMARILKNGQEAIALSDVEPSWGDELNLGNPSTLVSFVLWTAENHPADRFMLDIWGHGNGWPGSCPDKGDFLDTVELGQAMKDISDAGINIDIVSMDACQMGQIEVAYELRHGADYALLSQKDVPLNGWPYDLFLGHLKGSGDVTAKASAMIDSYIAWGMGGNSLYSLTLSLIDLSLMDELAGAIDSYANEAVLMTGYFNPEIAAARLATEKYDGNSQYDLVHLLQNINAKTECVRLEALSAVVFGVFDACIVHEKHWTNLLDEPADNAHGMSIWFPGHASTIDYLRTGFAKDTGWPDFLTTMAGYFQQPGKVQEPISFTAVSLDSDDDGLFDSIRINHGASGSWNITLEVIGPNNAIFSEIVIDAANEGSRDILLGTVGYYKAAMYLRDGSGNLLNYTLAKNLPKEELIVISGRVATNAGRGMAWVGVALMDSSGNMVEQVFTDNAGFYRLEIVAPGSLNGNNMSLVCGLGSGQQTIEIGTLEESFTADFEMKISSAYIPWVIRIVGFMNLLAIMMLIYWVTWGREKKAKGDAEKILVQQPIPPQ